MFYEGHSGTGTRFMRDTVALGQVSLPARRFFPVSIIPPMLHTHLDLHVAPIRRTNGRNLETFRKAWARKVLTLTKFGKSWSLLRPESSSTSSYFHSLFRLEVQSQVGIFHFHNGGEKPMWGNRFVSIECASCAYAK